MARKEAHKPIQIEQALHEKLQETADNAGISLTKLANLMLEKGYKDIEQNGLTLTVKKDGDKVIRTLQ